MSPLDLVNEQTVNERIRREAAFFASPRINNLSFLDMDTSRFNRWLIREVLKSWDKQLALLDRSWVYDKVVLEACCGMSRVLYYLHLLGPRKLIGCDVAKEFVATGLARSWTYVCGKKIPCSPPPFQTILGDVQNLPLVDESVDTVCCFQSLHHINVNRFATECERVLVPGGHVYISDPVGTHPLRSLGDWVGRELGPMSRDEKAYDPNIVIRVFERVGFRLLSLRSLNPLSEIYFQLTDLFSPISLLLSFYLKIPICFLNRIEPLLERTVLKSHANLGWRFALALEK